MRPLRLAAVLSLLAAVAPRASGARPLTAREEAGKRIYLAGESPSGAGISAVVGSDAVLPATAVPCAGCHGSDGLGRAEGGADPGPIVWSHLVKPYGHEHPRGRKHPPFTKASLARAITSGVDPAGNRLDPAMPRFSLSSEDMASLLAYLERLEHEADPGVSARQLRVGTVLPAGGALAPVGAAMRRVLEASIAELNAGGGIHGRRIALVVAEYDSDRESGYESATRLLDGEGVVAFVSGFAPRAERDLAALAEERKVPHVGPLTPFTGRRGEVDPHVFYVSAGVREGARALAAHVASDPELSRGPGAIVHDGRPELAEAADAARAELAARAVAAEVLGPERARDPSFAPRLRDAGVGFVLFLGGDAELAGFGRAADAAGWAPTLLVSALLSAGAAAELPSRFEGRILLAYPALPARASTPAAARFAAVRERARAGDAHVAAQASAYSAVAVLAEALRRAGRDVSRDRLVSSLEALYRFDPGALPPVTFGPSRRVGAQGAYVVALDLARGAFRPIGGWVAVE